MPDNEQGFIEPVSADDLEAAAAKGEMDAGSQALLKDEFKYIQARRKGAAETDLVGLALSGGGIRSASFALGVMQALAGAGLLKRIDYLSTVSGGGYIGASLSWLLAKRHSAHNFDLDARFPYAADGRPAKSKRWRMLRFLRSHGKYLTPGNGITLTSGLAVVLRGVILNLLVALPIAVAIAWWLLSVGSDSATGHGAAGADAASLWQNIEAILAFESERAAFGFILLLGGIAAALFTLLSVAYSLSSYFGFLLLGPVRRYKARRFVEIWIRWPLWITVATVAVGAIPWIVDTITGPPGLNDNASPCVALLYGIVSFIAGLIGGGFTYVKSRKVPPALLASVGATLLLVGFVLIAYGLAYCVRDTGGRWEGAMWLALGVAVFTGIFVNVNYITLHRFYRDRLMETFMPDVKKALNNLTGGAFGATVANFQGLFSPDHTVAPYHIVNTNAILVDSKVRRRRIRGGDSFILTPHYCGSAATGWVPTRDFLGGKLSLATAMAISGAAANPNTGAGGSGATRSRMVSLVMTLLNVRLGYWVANPRYHVPIHWARNHFVVAIQQILQGHREDWPLVELSDGGHFENLGLYELIRRRSKIIILCDGAADPRFEFGDLRIVMRRVEEDFGATVSFKGGDLEKLLPRPRDPDARRFPRTDELAETGFAVADIEYAGSRTGKLYYVKSTITKKAVALLKAYKAAFPDYPDETTADQFFSEEQFEAYRELGLELGTELLSDSSLASDLAAPTAASTD